MKQHCHFVFRIGCGGGDVPGKTKVVLKALRVQHCVGAPTFWVLSLGNTTTINNE